MFPCVKTRTTSNFAVKLPERSNHSFSVYLMNQNFQRSGLFNVEVVYVPIGNPAFCLALYVTGLHFRGKLQDGGHVGEQKIKCQPIRTREIGCPWLQKELCVCNSRMDCEHIKRVRSSQASISTNSFTNLLKYSFPALVMLIECFVFDYKIIDELIKFSR